MPERMECARCGSDQRRVEMEETEEGMLCEKCLREYLAEDARSWSVSFDTPLRNLAGIGVVVALAIGSCKVPQWQLERVRTSFYECINWELPERKRDPVECLSTFEGTGWLGYVPWTSDSYEDTRLDAQAEAHGQQLKWVSTVEPSEPARTKELETLTELHARGTEVYTELATPVKYLSGVAESIDQRRAKFADATLRDGTGGVRYMYANALVRLTRDGALRSWLVDAALATDQRANWFEQDELFEVARIACDAGRTEDGRALLDRFEELIARSGPDWRPTWKEASKNQREEYRAEFEKKAEAARRRAKLLRGVCGASTSDLSHWWSNARLRRLIAEATNPEDTWFRLAVIAHHLEERNPSLAELRKLVRETPHADFRGFAQGNVFSQLASRASGLFDANGEPRRLLQQDLYAPPSTYLEAAKALEGERETADESGGSSDSQGVASLVRALRARGAMAAARLGSRETALRAIESVEPQNLRLWSEFEVAVHRLFGDPKRAAHVWAGTDGEVASDGPTGATVEVRSRRVAALGAARNFDEAREAFRTADITAPENIRMKLGGERWVGLGYALAMVSGESVDNAIATLIPKSFQPSSLDSVRPQYLQDALRYAYRVRTAPPDERRALRNHPDGVLADEIWYQVAVGTAVDGATATEVWLDFVTGLETLSSPASYSWTRAEAARWRGDEKFEKRWMRRVFPEPESVDETDELLLQTL